MVREGEKSRLDRDGDDGHRGKFGRYWHEADG